MDRSELVAAAQAHGLRDPRVMPFRRRTGEMAWKLYFGPADARRDHLIEPGVTAADLPAILDRLRDG